MKGPQIAGGVVMSRTAKRGFVAFFFLSVLLGLAVSFAFVGGAGGAAKAQALPDVGKFRVGSTLGEERCGFSGRAKVLVFTSPDSPDWTALSQCLQSTDVVAQMDFFTGVLVDEKAEPDVEAALRARDGLGVVVRALNGGFLGGLASGFGCKDLVGLLNSIRESQTSPPEKSPLYANLLERTAPIDDMLQNGERAKAEKFAGFLEELEGASSPAVQAVKAKLGK
jgi:hypothetical protein